MTKSGALLKRFQTIIAHSSSLLFLYFSYAHAQVAETDRSSDSVAKTIIILDASGSMWGEIDGEHKIDIARDVLSGTIKDWAASAELGLMAYGHNRKGDCTDIETLIEIGSVDPEAFTVKAAALNPKGKTPMTAAVQMAAEKLKYTEEKATVILISDGKESCDLDPCKIGASLEKTGVDFTAHVIGFGVAKDETKGMRCLAKSTGGMFLEAGNANDLKEAMADARSVVTDKEEPRLDDATVSLPDKVVAGSVFKAEWVGPKNSGDYLIVRTNDRKQQYDYVYVGGEKKKSPSTLSAPETPGTYLVFYEVNEQTPLGQATLNVVPASATLTAPTTAVAGSELIVSWTGPNNEFDRIVISNVGGKNEFSEAYAFGDRHPSPAKLTTPESPGDYEIRFVADGGKSLAKENLTVTVASATISVPEREIVAGNAVEFAWTGPNNEFDRLAIFSLDGENEFESAYAFGDQYPSPAKISVPEKSGDYELRFVTNGGKILSKKVLTVKPASASISAPDTIVASEEFDVTWSGPNNEFDQLVIYNASKEQEFDSAYAFEGDYSSPSTLQAPDKPGVYHIRFMTFGGNELATQEIIVTRPH